MNVCSLMKQMWKLRKQDKHWQKMGKKESEYNEQNHLGEELPEGICSKLNVYRQNLKNLSKQEAIHPDTKNTGHSSDNSRVSTQQRFGGPDLWLENKRERRAGRGNTLKLHLHSKHTVFT